MKSRNLISFICYYFYNVLHTFGGSIVSSRRVNTGCRDVIIGSNTSCREIINRV